MPTRNLHSLGKTLRFVIHNQLSTHIGPPSKEHYIGLLIYFISISPDSLNNYTSLGCKASHFSNGQRAHQPNFYMIAPFETRIYLTH